jgi:hypothetical protein
MSLKYVADESVSALEEVFQGSGLSDEQIQKMSKIIEKTLIATVEQAAKAHHDATVVCCGAEAGMARSIREEVKRTNAALIANLMALR